MFNKIQLIEDKFSDIVSEMRVGSQIVTVTENVLSASKSEYIVEHSPYVTVIDGIEYITDLFIPNRGILELADGNAVSVSVNGDDYVGNVYDVDKESHIFKVKLTSGLSLFETWSRQGPYYHFGHPAELANKLDLLGNMEKTPFVWLFLDLSEDNKDRKFYAKFDNLKIAFVHGTSGEYYAEQRKDNVFDPVLMPLKESFIDILRKNVSGLDFPNDFEKNGVPHKTTRAYNYGSKYNLNNGNDSNKMNFYTDAVEINISDLRIINQPVNVSCTA